MPERDAVYLDGMEIKVSAHSAYRCQYHIVFVTKYRHRALNPAKFRIKAENAIRNTADRIIGVEIVELNIQPDHVHLVMIIPPRYSVSKVVEIIKSQSAKTVRREVEWLDKLYYDTPSLWTVGYFVSTVGVDEAFIKQYVKYQQKQDSGQAKLEF
ncbi:IS200/IS605 family transposase [Candidatus Poribacteria bacterium]|nr:IS200/IS605 family transposase [Candidatus Poribacteria bacterium]